MRQKRWKRKAPKASALFLTLLLFSGCAAETISSAAPSGETAMQSQPSQSSSETAALPQESTEIRDGTHERTLATPPDFPESYNYGSGRYTDWGSGSINRRLPLPQGNATVLNTAPVLTGIQALYLWEEGNFPAQTEVTTANFDPVDFRPYLTAIPVREGTEKSPGAGSY